MPMCPHASPARSTQRGALFGLDARIALAIFGLLSVVAGASMVLNLDESRAKGLVAELVDTARAVEAYHEDLRTDIFQSLTEPTESRAFQALFDNAVITEADNLRARWNGPYVKTTSVRSNNYGEMSIQKRGPNHAQPCDPEGLCFLWLVYSQVKPSLMKEANKLIDPEAERDPQTMGRLQWSQSEDSFQTLYFRAAKALSPITLQ